MLSRIAESMFWMNRYIERTEGTLRMLKVIYKTSLDKGAEQDYDWHGLLTNFFSADKVLVEDIRYDTHKVMYYILLDKNNISSVINIISQARENARGVQDHITKEVWESINEYYQYIHSEGFRRNVSEGEYLYAIGNLMRQGFYFYGVAEVTMPRGEGWNFMNLGKFIERAVLIANMLDLKFREIEYDIQILMDLPYWRNLLLSVSGYEHYMKSYHSGVFTQNILNMVIYDVQFPRSLLYSISKALIVFEKIFKDKHSNEVKLHKQLGRLKNKIEFSDIDSISHMGLHNYLTDIIHEVYDFNNALGTHYFAYG